MSDKAQNKPNDIVPLKAMLASTEKLYEALLHIESISQSPQDVILDYILNQAIEITQSKIGYIYFYDDKTLSLTNYAWSRNVLPPVT